MSSRLLIVICALLATSCSSVAITSNIDPDQAVISLGPDECIVVTKIRTNVANSGVLMHTEKQDKPVVVYHDVRGPEDLKVGVAMCHPVYFSRIWYGERFYWRDHKPVFDLVPGNINYVGDLAVEWQATSVRSAVIDRESETVEEARKAYPWLFKNHPYRNALKQGQ